MKQSHSKYLTVAQTDDRELAERLLKLLHKKQIDAHIITTDSAETRYSTTLEVCIEQYDVAYEFVHERISRGCSYGIPHVGSSKRPIREQNTKTANPTQAA